MIRTTLTAAALLIGSLLPLMSTSIAKAFPFNPKYKVCDDNSTAGKGFPCLVEFDKAGRVLWMKWENGEASAIGRSVGWNTHNRYCFSSSESPKYIICLAGKDLTEAVRKDKF